jgi:hypothetical protein
MYDEYRFLDYVWLLPIALVGALGVLFVALKVFHALRINRKSTSPSSLVGVQGNSVGRRDLNRSTS